MSEVGDSFGKQKDPSPLKNNKGESVWPAQQQRKTS